MSDGVDRRRRLLMAPTLSMATCATLDELASLLRALGPLYVRYSLGPLSDVSRQSMDGESGLPLSGLSANPLAPERWWTRPVEHWLARQLIQYRHLADDDTGEFAWALAGDEAARGPDCEPLLVNVLPVAYITQDLLDEADDVYSREFARARRPRPGDD